MDNKYLLPLLDEELNIIATVEFEDNLTLPDVPDYVNMNGLLGLKRLDSSYERLEGCLVFMCYDTFNPDRSYAELVSEKEAYKHCLQRGKLELASKLGLKFIEGVEVL